MAKHNQIGSLGEDIACTYFERAGFEIVERNYRKKWGEIDIVARETGQKGEILHFIEVKTVTREIGDDISCVTLGPAPEENVHKNKVDRLKRAIQTYLAERRVSYETYWEFSIFAVFVDPASKKALVRHTKDIVL